MTHRTAVINGKSQELVFCSSSVPADVRDTAVYGLAIGSINREEQTREYEEAVRKAAYFPVQNRIRQSREE
jgi:hypothetical protein